LTVLGQPRLGQGRKASAVERHQAQALLPGRQHRRGADRAHRFGLALGQHREVEVEADVRQARGGAARAFHAQLGFQANARPDQLGAVARQLAPPALELVHEARGIGSLEAGAPPAQQAQIRAQLFDQAALGGFVTHRHGTFEVHQAAVIDARAGRVAVHQGWQHGQRRTDLAQVEHQARQDAAGDAGQAAAAHVHQHAPAQVGQNARRHLAKLRPR
jgi:hypothetical protein